MKKTVGILALQGDFAEHAQCLQECGVSTVLIRNSSQLDKVDGLIVPGGESTAMTIIAKRDGLIEPLKEFSEQRPVWGTCAGLILLADQILNQQSILGGLDITIERNSYGRQLNSFESVVNLDAIGIKGMEGMFIRAPRIIKVGSRVETIGTIESVAGKTVVAVRQGNVLGTTFHTELANDNRLLKYFASMI